MQTKCCLEYILFDPLVLTFQIGWVDTQKRRYCFCIAWIRQILVDPAIGLGFDLKIDVLILSGIAVLMGSLAPFAVIPLFAFLIDRLFIQVEESMLAARFGSSWSQYRRDVRRWI